MNSPFHIYDGISKTSQELRAQWLDNLPPWRRTGPPWSERKDKYHRQSPEMTEAEVNRAKNFVIPSKMVLERVNMALHLRRPLLVSGDPGLGKTSLGWSIAHFLGLGAPLRWEINSRTTLEDGLYTYDAIAHLQDTRAGGRRPLADFVTLGPLGTALLPTSVPRLLIVDELDKSSYDLPNDLLHVFEEGQFKIPALVREDAAESKLLLWDSQDKDDRAPVQKGVVRSVHHPVIVVTTNREREFADAFLRRCVKCELTQPSPAKMAEILSGWLGPDLGDLTAFVERFPLEHTDVLLQALFLSGRAGGDPEEAIQALRRRGGEGR